MGIFNYFSSLWKVIQGLANTNPWWSSHGTASYIPSSHNSCHRGKRKYLLQNFVFHAYFDLFIYVSHVYILFTHSLTFAHAFYSLHSITSIHFSLLNIQNNKLFENFSLKHDTDSSNWTAKYCTWEPYNNCMVLMWNISRKYFIVWVVWQVHVLNLWEIHGNIEEYISDHCVLLFFYVWKATLYLFSALALDIKLNIYSNWYFWLYCWVFNPVLFFCCFFVNFQK